MTEKNINRLLRQKRELWEIWKVLLDKYNIYDNYIMDKFIKLNEKIEKYRKIS